MRRSAVMLAVFGLAAAGCGEAKDARQKPTFPVTGTVLVNGKPAPEARVMFNPTIPFSDDFTPLPQGIAQDDGTFTVSTYSGADGAPAGEYAVTIVWQKSPRPNSRERGPDLLAGKYGNAKKTQFKVHVTEGPNNLPAFELSADEKKMAKLSAKTK